MTAPRTLSHTWPRMSVDARELVRSALRRGCNCPASTATLCRYPTSREIVVLLLCDGCGRDLSGPMSIGGHPFWQNYRHLDATWRAPELEPLR